MKKYSNFLLDTLKEWFFIIWTAPQELLGSIVSVVVGAEEHEYKIDDKTYVYYLAKRFNNTWSGVSLGDYIIFAKGNFVDDINVRHEYGHQIQSLILGPLYLIVIGLPSFIGNIWDRVIHKNWSCLDRVAWYYTQPHEHWADKIGGITLEDRGV